MRAWVLAAIFMVWVLPGCASKGKSASGESRFASAAAQEFAIGQQIHNTILQSFYPYTDPKVVNYVNGIGDSLAEQGGRRELTYQFTILYSDKIYATSAPGGFVYVTTGMLYFLENEAELAGVLAHEIGQLQYRDPQIVSNGHKVLEAVTRGGAMVGPAFGPIGALAALGLVAVNHVAQPHEVLPEDKLIRADKLALQYMLDAGQDPQGLVDIFHKMLRARGEVIPYFFDYYQSRPISEGRLLALDDAFADLELEGRTFQTNREAYQEMTKGIREMYKAA